MLWRLIVLGCLAVGLAIGCVASMNAAIDLSFRSEQIYGDGQKQPTVAQMDASTRLSQEAWGLSMLVTPMAAGSFISALAIPAVLGRRWQVREAAAAASPAPERAVR